MNPNRHRLFCLLGLISAVIALPVVPAIAAPQWTKVTENRVGDQFLLDRNAIQAQGTTRFYWEYREFVAPNNALVEVPLSQPVEGAVMRWSINCTNKSHRLLRINAYTTDRQLIQKFTYGDTGIATTVRPGSSTAKVGEAACAAKL
jgi:hypothetical protein